jgi:hypothetical protein
MAFAILLRKSMVWLVLLALLAPAVALAGTACCASGQAYSADCCAQAMKMPGMDAPQMRAMSRAPEIDVQNLGVFDSHCAPILQSEAMEFALPAAGGVDGSIRLVSNDSSAPADQNAVIFSRDGLHLFLVDGTPPKIPLSDCLPAVLRI